MAKGKSSQFDPVHPAEKTYFVNSIGEQYEIRGLPPLLMADIYVSITLPKKPTYTVITASGDTEIHDHDESTLVTPEDRAAWAEYLDALSKADAEVSNRLLTCVLIDGVYIPDDIDLARWERRQILKGFTIPEDFEEKLLAYKRSSVVRSKEDIVRLLSSVISITGISEEEIESAKKSFPDQLESNS